MRVVLCTIGKFHTFDLARQLEKHGMLEAIFTGYPRFKLKDERLDPSKIRSYPYLQTLYMARGKIGLSGEKASKELAYWSHVTLAKYAARHMPKCDVFLALSGSGLEAGLAAQRQGAKYICDRGSAHIRAQEEILANEFKRLGLPRQAIDPRKIQREESEYAAADMIFVPSIFSLESFVNMGVPATKLRTLAYGVDLSKFTPAGSPDPERFDILFVGGASVQKGTHYLLEAYRQVKHPRKSLRFVGAVREDVEAMVKKAAAEDPSIVLSGHCPQNKLKDIMSTSHVLVLPSIQDGFGMVMGQAMACGCPVVASTNTGARDLYMDGEAGYIVPSHSAEALAEALQKMADNPAERARMSENALVAVKKLGGWDSYGDQVVKVLTTLS